MVIDQHWPEAFEEMSKKVCRSRPSFFAITKVSQVAAIDAVTGETKWLFDPKVYDNNLGPPANLGWTHRGVAYWRNGNDERIRVHIVELGLGLGRTIGQPAIEFGDIGRLHSSPRTSVIA